MKRLLGMLLAVCLLSGCTLATEAGEPEGLLMGFLVTVTLPGGEEIWDEEVLGVGYFGHLTNEGQRLYAEKTEDGYAFSESCGLSCFGYYVIAENPDDSYRTSWNDPELGRSHWGQHIGDGGSKFSLDADIYGVAGCGTEIQINPIYQTSEGEVYALCQPSWTYDVGNLDGYGYTMTQETKIDMGVDTANGGTVTVNISSVMLPETYNVIEMSADHQVLMETEFAPDAMPERYAPAAEAAYIILEAVGEQTVRTVYSPADDSAVMDTFYPGRYGLCIKGYTKIDWEGA